MKYLILILTFFTLQGAAQSEEEAVKQPIIALFKGMRQADSNLLKSAFAPGALLQTVAVKDGETVVSPTSLASFIAGVSRPRKEVLDERISFGSITIDGELASVWTPYRFFVDNKFHHCGVNSFQLVKTGSSWKILYIIDTRRTKDCP